eukprot:TRINITY_DN48333_c0_g1_i1.p2 TRINITY_DN48333_c0_g1~~TRINITY_DN48333_c0_g1_i1.p2  ORF type:complete len:160 (-),score=45.74 TRINITY_DN48333_c0_g1_i1:48-527(-)
MLLHVFFYLFFFFFSSRRRHTRCREVSWARRCVQETGTWGLLSYSPCLPFLSTPYSVLLVLFPFLSFIPALVIPHSAFFFSSIRQILRFLQTSHSFSLIITPFTIFSFYFLPVSYTHLTLPTILLVQISGVAVSLKKKKQRNRDMIHSYQSSDNTNVDN